MEPDDLDRLPAGMLRDFMQGLAIMDGFGLTEGFGHLSARLPEGALITPALAPGLAREADLITVDPAGKELKAAQGRRPALETPLHMALYRARPDIGALCRTHSPWAVAWGLRGEAFRPAHGFGLMLGRSVPYHAQGDLITSAAAADAAALSMGAARALFLKGNGLVVAGKNLREAVLRALYLEESCRAVLRSGGIGVSAEFDGSDYEDRCRWHDAELVRAWDYYSARASIRVPK